MEQTKSYVRVQQSWLAPAERVILVRIAKALPRWVQPDHLTILGIGGSLACGVGFAASRASSHWLMLVFIGLLFNWFGDSLDGSLARARQTERPKYGFFVDHTSDILSQALIFMGMAISPYVRFETGCLFLMSYWLAAMFTFIRTISAQVFQISYYGIGPTEIRVGLIVYALSLLTVGPLPIAFRFGVLSVMDLIAAGTFMIVMASFVLMAFLEARRLQTLESRKGPSQHLAGRIPAGYGGTFSDPAASWPRAELPN